MRSKFVLLIALLVLSSVPAAEGMEFTVQYNGGNCGSCTWVLAEGVISSGTTEKFKAFVAKEKPPNNLVFDSPGGNVLEALKLGQFLRQSNWNTLVGEQNPIIPGSHFSKYKTQKSSCYSACVYAFAGGVHRYAADRSVGIHQFYRPDDALRPNDKTLSAVDMANTQQLAALLNEYVRQMGIDPRLVTIASSITPWDPIYVLSGAELKSLNLDNSSAAISGASANWSVQPAGNGAIATATQAQDGAGRMASLGIMCIQSRPNTVIVRLAVQDDNVDWTSAISSSGLSPQSFNFEIDGTYGELKSDRLISPIERMGNGVLFDLAITQDELGRIMSAKSVRIAAFVNMASQRWTGPLGGTFSMMGAPAAISLALKNCLN